MRGQLGITVRSARRPKFSNPFQIEYPEYEIPEPSKQEEPAKSTVIVIEF